MNLILIIPAMLAGQLPSTEALSADKLGRQPLVWTTRVTLTSATRGEVVESARITLINRSGLQPASFFVGEGSTETLILVHKGKRTPLTRDRMLNDPSVVVEAGDVLESRVVTPLRGEGSVEGIIPLVGAPGDTIDFELVAPATIKVSASFAKKALTTKTLAGRQTHTLRAPFASVLEFLPRVPGPESVTSLPPPERFPNLLFSTARSWDALVSAIEPAPAIPDALFARLTAERQAGVGPLSSARDAVVMKFKSATATGALSTRRLADLKGNEALTPIERASLIVALGNRLGAKARLAFFASERTYEPDPNVPQRAGLSTPVIVATQGDGSDFWLLPETIEPLSLNLHFARLAHILGPKGLLETTTPSQPVLSLKVATSVTMPAGAGFAPVVQTLEVSEALTGFIPFSNASMLLNTFPERYGDKGKVERLDGSGLQLRWSSQKARVAQRDESSGSVPIGWPDVRWAPVPALRSMSDAVDAFTPALFTSEATTSFNMPVGWKHDASTFSYGGTGPVVCRQTVQESGAMVVVTRVFSVTGRVIPASGLAEASKALDQCLGLNKTISLSKAR